MTFEITIVIIGAVFLLVGIAGGGLKIQVKEGGVTVPTISVTLRAVSFLIGATLVAVGLWRGMLIDTTNPQPPEAALLSSNTITAQLTPTSQSIDAQPTEQPSPALTSVQTGLFIATQPLVINGIAHPVPPNQTRKCIASEQTGSNTVEYVLNVPTGWVVVWDSWKADWSDGSYDDDGLLAVYGEWSGTVTVVNGQYCAAPIEWVEYALNDRRSAAPRPDREEFHIGDVP